MAYVDLAIYRERKLSFDISKKTQLLEFSIFSRLPSARFTLYCSFQACCTLSWVIIYLKMIHEVQNQIKCILLKASAWHFSCSITWPNFPCLPNREWHVSLLLLFTQHDYKIDQSIKFSQSISYVGELDNCIAAWLNTWLKIRWNDIFRSFKDFAN